MIIRLLRGMGRDIKKHIDKWINMGGKKEKSKEEKTKDNKIKDWFYDNVVHIRHRISNKIYNRWQYLFNKKVHMRKINKVREIINRYYDICCPQCNEDLGVFKDGFGSENNKCPKCDLLIIDPVDMRENPYLLKIIEVIQK